jgi:hypothetical protein
VNLAYTGTAADGADFTGVASVVVTGGNTSTTFTLETLDDALVDNAETIIIDIDSIVDTNNSFESTVEGASNQVTTLINDQTGSDSTPGPNDQVTVSLVGPAMVNEGETTSNYTVSLDQAVPAGNNITVNLIYSGTATDGSDFTGVTRVVVTGPANTATFTIAALTDGLIDNAETIVVDIDSIVDTNNSFEALVEGIDRQVTTSISDLTDVVLQEVTPRNPTPVSVAVVSSDSTRPTTSSPIVKDTTAVDIVRIFGNSAEDFKINPIALRGQLADQAVTEGFKEYVISDGEFDSGSGKKLSYEALLSTGEPLPDYIKFDESTGTFKFDADLAKLSGIENVEIRVVARDPDGNRLSTSFEVEFGEVESTDSGSGSEDSDSLIDGESGSTSGDLGENNADGSEASGEAGDGAGMEGEPALEEQDAQPIRLVIELANQYVQTDIVRYSIADTFISTLGDSLKIVAQMEDGSDLPEYIVFDEKSEEFIINGELANELGIESVVIQVLAIDSDGNSSSDSFLIEFEPGIVQDDAAVQSELDPVASRIEVPGVSYQIMSLDGADFEQIFAQLLETMSSDVDVDESEEENQTKEDLNSQIARAGEFGFQQDKLELSELLKKIFK